MKSSTSTSSQISNSPRSSSSIILSIGRFWNRGYSFTWLASVFTLTKWDLKLSRWLLHGGCPFSKLSTELECRFCFNSFILDSADLVDKISRNDFFLICGFLRAVLAFSSRDNRFLLFDNYFAILILDKGLGYFTAERSQDVGSFHLVNYVFGLEFRILRLSATIDEI